MRHGDVRAIFDANVNGLMILQSGEPDGYIFSTRP